MRILALDSSSMVASAAIITDDILTAEFTVNDKKTHSQTLLPMIDQMVRMAGIELNTIDAIAVAAGPGSFTGLRIGAATAKGLGLALDKPLISVPTVDALAYNLFGAEGLVVPIMDARRNQVYTGIYSFSEDSMQIIKAQCPISIEELAEELNKREQKVTFVGDGIPVYQAWLGEKLTIPHGYAPAHMNRQRAGAVGALGVLYYRQGKVETARMHRPDYLRLSQAERELAEREAAGNVTS